LGGISITVENRNKKPIFYKMLIVAYQTDWANQFEQIKEMKAHSFINQLIELAKLAN
jgi:hypothetical protein